MTERLSDKNPCDSCKVDRQIGNPNRWECECSRCDKPNDWKNECVKKLSEYETAEEEGRLVVLPYKLNETAYLLLDKRDFTEKIIKCRIREISIGFYGMKLSLISEDSMIGHLKWHDVNEIGKTVFFTREEAEKALKEMEEKHERIRY